MPAMLNNIEKNRDEGSGVLQIAWSEMSSVRENVFKPRPGGVEARIMQTSVATASQERGEEAQRP